MTRNDTDIDARLRALDPMREDGRSPCDEAWAQQVHIAITEDPSRRPQRDARSGRWVRRLIPAVAAAALIAMVAALLINTGNGPDTPNPDRRVLLSAASSTTPAALEADAGIILERADRMGLQGVTVGRHDDGLALGLPTSADDATLDSLIAPGRLAVLPYESTIVAAGLPNLDAAVRRAQATSGAPVTGGAGDAVPAGFLVARSVGDAGTHGETSPTTFLVFRGRPALTEADVAGVVAEPADRNPAVTLHLTRGGRRAFADLTRSLSFTARIDERAQHVAIIVDGLLLARPAMDHENYPGGIDPVNGVQVSVPTPSVAQSVAAQLGAGPLAADLVPTSGG